MKKKQAEDTNLLRRALRLAAVEAYHAEVMDTEMYSILIGTNKEYATMDDWVQERIDSWLEEAEIV